MTDFTNAVDLMSAYSNVRSVQQMSKRQFTNYRNWFMSNPNAIEEKERQYIYKDDVIPIKARPEIPVAVALINKIIRYLRILFHDRFRFHFKESSQSNAVNYTSDTDGVTLFEAIIALAASLLLILGPLWSLAYIETVAARLGVITGFITLLTASLSLFATSNLGQVLGIIAA